MNKQVDIFSFHTAEDGWKYAIYNVVYSFLGIEVYKTSLKEAICSPRGDYAYYRGKKVPEYVNKFLKEFFE